MLSNYNVMSQITKNNNNLKLLLQEKRELYHTQDLMVLWRISNENTLYKTINRYIKRGLLYSIYKGFYATRPLQEINPLLLGSVALHKYNYLSTESILALNGVITQELNYMTFVSGNSKRLEIGDHNIISRKMKDDYLYNKEGVFCENSIRKATTERAVADMLYFNPNYHFDGKNFINWKKVKEIQKKIGY